MFFCKGNCIFVWRMLCAWELFCIWLIFLETRDSFIWEKSEFCRNEKSSYFLNYFVEFSFFGKLITADIKISNSFSIEISRNQGMCISRHLTSTFKPIYLIFQSFSLKTVMIFRISMFKSNYTLIFRKFRNIFIFSLFSD